MTAAHDAALFTSDSAGGPHDGCSCAKCWNARHNEDKQPWERLSIMHLCAICGNKRCPHAADHELACTGSNEPGQGIVPPDRKAAEDLFPGTVDYPVCHKVRARALERENAELKKELAELKTDFVFDKAADNWAGAKIVACGKDGSFLIDKAGGERCRVWFEADRKQLNDLRAENDRLKILVTRFLNQPLSDLIDDDLLTELTK